MLCTGCISGSESYTVHRHTYRDLQDSGKSMKLIMHDIRTMNK